MSLSIQFRTLARATSTVIAMVAWLSLPSAGAGEAPAPPRLQVEIRPLQGELLDNVRASLGLLRHARDPNLGERRIRALFERAEGEIRQALEPFGYYRPEVHAELFEPRADGAPWIAQLRIEPGPALRVSELDLQLGEAAVALRGVFPLKPGDQLDHRRYQDGKQALLRRARAMGYLRAALALHRIEIDPRHYRATVRLHLDPGPLHRFRGVSFEQTGFNEDYLRAFVPMRSGDPYTQASEQELRRALVASGQFKRVEIERLPNQEQDSPDVYLMVRLEAHKRNRYRARLGWGTDTGFGLQFDWTRRNLWQESHQLSLGTVFVQERAKLVGEARYEIPSDPLFNRRIEFLARHQGKDLSFEDAGLSEGDKTRILNNTFGLYLPRPRRLWGGVELQENLSLTYLTESYDTFDVVFGHYTPFMQDYFAKVILQGDDRDTMRAEFQGLVVGADWTYRTLDDPLYTRRGDYLRLTLKGAHESLLSNFSFLQTRVQAATIHPIGSGRLILRGDLAYTAAQTIRLETFEDLVANQIPELYEFRAGGDRSVRGYKYEELLPDNSFTGGKHLAVGSIEYDHEVIPDWRAAAFVDVGTAFNAFDNVKPGIGIGGGVRWLSPIGPVRLDLALPLTEAESPFRIHVTIGPEF